MSIGVPLIHDASPRHRSSILTTEMLLFLLFLIAHAYFFPRWADWNQNSRFALTLALVEEHTFSIDNFYQRTGDYAIYKGRRYTDKAPGLSFLAVPPYLAFKALEQLPIVSDALNGAQSNVAFTSTLREGGSGMDGDKVAYAAALYLATFFTVSLPSALLWVLLYRFLGYFAADPRPRLLIVLALGLGTVAFPYASVFYSHQTAAFLIFAAFYLLARIKRQELSPRYLWLVGAALGLAVITDYPALLATAVLVAYAASFSKRKRPLAIIALAALPFATLLAFYNYVCFESPFASSYRYLALFPEQAEYGVLGFSYPQWRAFWGITFSPYRGLFFSSPFLLLALPGLWLWWRSRAGRGEGLVCTAAIALYLLFIASYYDWKGGFAVAAPRNLIPLIPFTALPLLYYVRWAAGRRWALFSTLGLMAAGLMAFLVQTAGGQDFAPIAIANPLFEFFWPRLLSGEVNRNLGMLLHLPGWYSLLPLLLLVAALTRSLWLAAGRGKSWTAMVA